MATNSALNTSTNSAALVSSSTGLPTWTAAMTNGQVVIGSTGATPTAAGLTAGTNVSISTGAGSITINADGAAGGGLFLIQSQTANNSAQLDFTTGITSTYNTYLFTITNLLPATDGDTLRLRVSTDGGGSFLATAYDYNYQQMIGVTPTINQVGSTGDSGIKLALNVDSTTGGGLSGIGMVFSPSSSAFSRIWNMSDYTNNTSNVHVSFWVSGGNTGTTAINGLRFFYGSGNTTSGRITLYGLKVS